MIRKGQIVVVRDPDLLDMYTGEVVRDELETRRNILVRIRTMIRYPIQHAIINPDCANENPPIQAGTVCRLEYVRTVTTHDAAYCDYEATLARCLEEYYRARKGCFDADAVSATKRYNIDPAEFEILDRHRRKDFRARRVVMRH